MASTNKTANLHLNQWAATDPVLREDFNADNAAIDAAFGKLPIQKLWETTTTQAAQVVEINLPAIDLDQYTELRFLMNLKTAADNNIWAEAELFFNQISASNTTKLNYVNPTNPNHGQLSAPFLGRLPENTSYPPTVWDIRMAVSPAGSSNFRTYAGQSLCSCPGSNPQVSFAAYTLYTNQLSKLIVRKKYTGADYPTSQSIGVGSKLTIYGVKK